MDDVAVEKKAFQPLRPAAKSNLRDTGNTVKSNKCRRILVEYRGGRFYAFPFKILNCFCRLSIGKFSKQKLL